VRLLADENLDNDILRGLQLRKPDLDIVRVQDIPEIYEKSDPIVLEWAAQQNRVVLTHDVRTMTRDTYARIDQGLPVPRVIEIIANSPIGEVIDDLVLIIEEMKPSEIENQIIYVPL
jgi:hypothetical protein